jgi:hypothetical protein
MTSPIVIRSGAEASWNPPLVPHREVTNPPNQQLQDLCGFCLGYDDLCRNGRRLHFRAVLGQAAQRFHRRLQPFWKARPGHGLFLRQ